MAATKDYSKGAKFDLAEYNKNMASYIGVTCWWTISETEKQTEQVKDLLTSCGIDPNWINNPTEKTALKRAGKKLSDTDNHTMCRKVTDRLDRNVIAIVKESVDVADEKLEYVQQTTARLDKNSGKLEVEGANAEQLRQSFNESKGMVTDDDIRYMVRKIIGTLHCVPLRPTGGIYFVPKENVEPLTKLDNFLRTLGVGKMIIAKMQDGSVEREITWESMEVELEKRLNDTIKAVEAIEKRAGALSNHEDKVNEMKKVFEHYVKLTESESAAESLREKIEAVEKLITQKMEKLG